MRYPRKPSLVGIIIGAFGLLQLFVGLLFIVMHFEVFDVEALIDSNEHFMQLVILGTSHLGSAWFFDEMFVLVGVSLIINACVYIGFYLVINKVNQTNAMVKKMYDRLNKY